MRTALAPAVPDPTTRASSSASASAAGPRAARRSRGRSDPEGVDPPTRGMGAEVPWVELDDSMTGREGGWDSGRPWTTPGVMRGVDALNAARHNGALRSCSPGPARIRVSLEVVCMRRAVERLALTVLAALALAPTCAWAQKPAGLMNAIGLIDFGHPPDFKVVP